VQTDSARKNGDLSSRSCKPETHPFLQDKNRRFYRAKEAKNEQSLHCKTEPFFDFACSFCGKTENKAVYLYFRSIFAGTVTENVSRKLIFLDNHLALGGNLAVPLRQSLFKFK
jgi:hypothetical protein